MMLKVVGVPREKTEQENSRRLTRAMFKSEEEGVARRESGRLVTGLGPGMLPMLQKLRRQAKAMTPVLPS